MARNQPRPWQCNLLFSTVWLDIQVVWLYSYFESSRTEVTWRSCDQSHDQINKQITEGFSSCDHNLKILCVGMQMVLREYRVWLGQLCCVVPLLYLPPWFHDTDFDGEFSFTGLEWNVFRVFKRIRFSKMDKLLHKYTLNVKSCCIYLNATMLHLIAAFGRSIYKSHHNIIISDDLLLSLNWTSGCLVITACDEWRTGARGFSSQWLDCMCYLSGTVHSIHKNKIYL